MATQKKILKSGVKKPGAFKTTKNSEALQAIEKARARWLSDDKIEKRLNKVWYTLWNNKKNINTGNTPPPSSTSTSTSTSAFKTTKNSEALQAIEKARARWLSDNEIEKRLNKVWYTLWNNKKNINTGNTPSSPPTFKFATTPEALKAIKEAKAKWFSDDKIEGELNKMWYTLWWKNKKIDTSPNSSDAWIINNNNNTNKKDIALEIESMWDWIKTSMMGNAIEKWNIISGVTNEESELTKKTNEEKSKRILGRETMLKDVMSKYTSDIDISKKMIAEDLDRSKRIQSRQANMAVASAWQWPWISVWTRNQIEADTMARFDSNVWEATRAATQNLQSLAEAEKNTWIQKIWEQDKIDLLMNNMTDNEYNIFIKSAQDIWLEKTLALGKYQTYIDWINQERFSSSENRYLQQLKTDQNKNTYVTNNDKDKFDMLVDKLPKWMLSEEEIKGLMSKYGNNFYWIIAEWEKKAKDRETMWTLSTNMLIQEATKLSPEWLKQVLEHIKTLK